MERIRSSEKYNWQGFVEVKDTTVKVNRGVLTSFTTLILWGYFYDSEEAVEAHLEVSKIK